MAIDNTAYSTACLIKHGSAASSIMCRDVLMLFKRLEDRLKCQSASSIKQAARYYFERVYQCTGLDQVLIKIVSSRPTAHMKAVTFKPAFVLRLVFILHVFSKLFNLPWLVSYVKETKSLLRTLFLRIKVSLVYGK